MASTKALQYGQIVKMIQNGALYAFSSSKVGDEYVLISNGDNTVPNDNLPAGAIVVLNIGTANTTTAPTIKLADPQVALPITKKGGGALAIGELGTGSQILISRVTYFELMPVGGLVSSVSGRTGDVVLTKTDVGLSNVDNTTDLLKPISAATQNALDGKSATMHNHTGIYEPIDATILRSASIGVLVQAYDADLTSWATIAPSAKQDALVSGTNIKTINGSSVLGAGNIVISGGGSINYGLLNNSIIQTGGSF